METTLTFKESNRLEELLVSEPAPRRVETPVLVPKTPRPVRNLKPLKIGIVVGVVVAAIATGGVRWWNFSRTWETTDNAYVTAHVHQISPRVAGTVLEVLVEDNQLVAAGTPLAKLDPRDLEVRREQARSATRQAEAQIAQTEAQAAQAAAQVEQSQAQIAQATAQVAREQANVDKATKDFSRAEELFSPSNGAISRSEFDSAKAARDTALAALDAAQASLNAARATTESAKAMVKSAQAARAVATAQRQSAENSLKDAELQLSYTTIYAPTAGRIGHKGVEAGNRVQPGQSLMALVNDDVWVVANFKETQLGKLTPGQPVVIKVDAFPGREFTGRVESFSPASGAQFALLPPDNATGNFTKVVQRVPVKIVFDPETLKTFAGRVVPGMSVEAEVKVRGGKG